MNNQSESSVPEKEYSSVKNYLECPSCRIRQEIVWDFFPEDVKCRSCGCIIETEGFEPSEVVYRKPVR